MIGHEANKSQIHQDAQQNDYIHISFSEFSMYNECPHKHLILKYLKLDEQAPSIHLFFGNAIHESIEVGIKNNLSKEQREKYFCDKFKKDMMDNMFNSPQFSELENFTQQGKNILSFIDIEKIFGQYKIVSVEEQLYETIYKKFKFKGFIDMVLYNEDKDRYLITDWKTSGEEWDVSKKKKDQTFLCQMRFYKFFWAKKNNIPLDKIDCRYIVLNRLKNKNDIFGGFGEIQIVDVNSDENEILQSLEKLANTVMNIHIEQNFPKVKITGNERFNCMFCQFKGGNHPLCNSKYNQYVELLNTNKKA